MKIEKDFKERKTLVTRESVMFLKIERLEKKLRNRYNDYIEEIKPMKDLMDMDVAKIQKSIDEQKGELKMICTHPPERKYKKEHNIEGNYLDTATYTTTWFCGFCNKELSKDVKHGGYG